MESQEVTKDKEITSDISESSVTQEENVLGSDSIETLTAPCTITDEIINAATTQQENETDAILVSRDEHCSDTNLTDSPANSDGYILDSDEASILNDHRECLDREQCLQTALNAGRLETQKLKEAYSDLEIHSQKVQKDLGNKLINLQKLYDKAVQEKESAVVRYAVSEKKSLDMKQALKEIELLQGKLKMATNERARICNMFDMKCHDLTAAQKEYEHLKAELNSLDAKLKWSQVNLKQEKEARMALEERCENLAKEVDELRIEKQLVDQASKDVQKLTSLEKQLTEEQAKLILERHKRTDYENQCNDLQNHMQHLKSEVEILKMANHEYKNKIERLQMLQIKMENDFKETRNKEVETTHQQLFEAQTVILSYEQEIDRLRKINLEMSQELAQSRNKEMEILVFTQQLTNENVSLQTKYSALEGRILGSTTENFTLKQSLDKKEREVLQLSQELDNECKKRAEESAVLAKHLAVKTEAISTLETQLEELKGEIQVMKRKHAAVVKEITRELQHLRKTQKLEPDGSLDALAGPHKGSASSLSSSSDPTSCHEVSSIQVKEPDRQALVEKIVKLQRARAKQTEKIDFLEEHCQALVAEIQKKTRLMQVCLLRDYNNGMSEPEITVDSLNTPIVTLEVAEKMNRKLQMVLEDTILKNVALKESVDTLATEVARLNKKLKEGA